MADAFNGHIELDVRDSTPDWAPYIAAKAPEGAPNVLIVLYDDTGQAAWSPFGGRINMPTLQKLADNGLMYSQWHTTALCSPTRSTFLTGRNHHQNGMSQHHRRRRAASLAPTATSRTPAAPMAEVLRDERLEHLLDRQEPQRPGRRAGTRRHQDATGRCRRASTASTGSSAARRTSGTRISSTTTTRSTSPISRRRATTSPRTWPTRRSRC